jgi:hypothetical protein
MGRKAKLLGRRDDNSKGKSNRVAKAIRLNSMMGCRNYFWNLDKAFGLKNFKDSNTFKLNLNWGKLG